MEKVNQELVLAYREIESKAKAQEEAIANLSEKLKTAHSELNQATATLEKAEKDARNNKLTTVTAIEKTRENVQYAKYAAEDHEQVTENLKHAIENARTSTSELHKRKTTIENKLWTECRELLRAEIKELLGDRIEKFWTAIILANPGTIPTHLGFPDDLTRFMSCNEYNDVRNTLMSEILNGTSNTNNVE